MLGFYSDEVDLVLSLLSLVVVSCARPPHIVIGLDFAARSAGQRHIKRSYVLQVK